jgi:hypothetical protein
VRTTLDADARAPIRELTVTVAWLEAHEIEP